MSDLISRQAAIDVIDAILPVEPMKNEYTQGITCGAALAIEYVKQLPSAQPKQEPGEWKPYTYVDPDDWYQDKEIRYRCSKCGVEVIDKSNFCPNCGADMRVAERREE